MPRRDFVASPAFNLDEADDFGEGVKTAGHPVYGFYDGLPKDDAATQPGWNPLKLDSSPPPPPPPPPPPAPCSSSSTKTTPSSRTPRPTSPFGTFPDPPPQSNLTLQQLLEQNGFHDDRFSLAPSFRDTIASQAISGLSVGQLEEFVFSVEGGMDWGSAAEGGRGGATGVDQRGSQSVGTMEVPELVNEGMPDEPAYDLSFEE